MPAACPPSPIPNFSVSRHNICASSTARLQRNMWERHLWYTRNGCQFTKSLKISRFESIVCGLTPSFNVPKTNGRAMMHLIL